MALDSSRKFLLIETIESPKTHDYKYKSAITLNLERVLILTSILESPAAGGYLNILTY